MKTAVDLFCGAGGTTTEYLMEQFIWTEVRRRTAMEIIQEILEHVWRDYLFGKTRTIWEGLTNKPCRAICLHRHHIQAAKNGPRRSIQTTNRVVAARMTRQILVSSLSGFGITLERTGLC